MKIFTHSSPPLMKFGFIHFDKRWLRCLIPAGETVQHVADGDDPARDSAASLTEEVRME